MVIHHSLVFRNKLEFPHLQLSKEHYALEHQQVVDVADEGPEMNVDITMTNLVEDDSSSERNVELASISIPVKPSQNPVAITNIEKQDFKCNLCEKSFTQRDLLIMHWRNHSFSRKKPYKCSLCPESFEELSHLGGHMRTHSNIGEYKPHVCKLCGMRFAEQKDLDNHEHLCKPYQCRFCKMRFITEEDCQEHEQNKHINKVTIGIPRIRKNTFKCRFCDKGFAQKHYLFSHERLHQGESFPCLICQKEFVSMRNLEGHMRTHTHEKPYNCHWCDNSFAHNSILCYHERSHTGNKPFKCKMCPKQFVSGPCLTKHMKIHSKSTITIETEGMDNCGNDELLGDQGQPDYEADTERLDESCVEIRSNSSEPEIMKILNVATTSSSRDELQLVIPKRENTLPSNSEIDISVPFLAKQEDADDRSTSAVDEEADIIDLSQEAPLHATLGEAPLIKGKRRTYNCMFCMKSFLRENFRNDHEKLHIGGGFKCVMCHKSFPRYANLERHLRHHTNEKPYSCKECDRPFAYPDSLAIHMRSHTGSSRPLQCTFCFRRFSIWTTFNLHNKKRMLDGICAKYSPKSGKSRNKSKLQNQNLAECDASRVDVTTLNVVTASNDHHEPIPNTKEVLTRQEKPKDHLVGDLEPEPGSSKNQNQQFLEILEDVGSASNNASETSSTGCAKPKTDLEKPVLKVYSVSTWIS